MADQSQAGAVDDDAPFPRPARAWGAVAVLAVVTVFAFLDRQLIYLMVDPMRKTLGVTDTQISLIQGLAFVLFFTLVGLPLGRMADRFNRRNLIIVGVLLWSLMTMLCGLAHDFWSLFAARSGVGIGEAILAPAAYSMVSDYFAPTQRGRAIGVISMCSGVGAGLSFMAGSAILRHIPGDSTVHIPVFGAVLGWQLVFILAGLPGAVVSLLLFLVREPQRRELATSDYKHTNVWPLLRRHWSAHWRAFVAVYGAAGFLALMSYAISGWTIAYFIRHFGMSASVVGAIVGATVIFSGLIQGPASGFVGDMFAKWRLGGRILIFPVLCLVALPFSIAWPLATTPMLALTLLVLANTIGNTALLTGPALVQELAPNEIRGLLLAGLATFQGIIGAGLGPTSVALVTDFVFHDDTKLGFSIMAIAVPSYVMAALLAGFGARSYARCRADVLALTSHHPIDLATAR